MARASLTAETRTPGGDGAAGRLRREGKVPGIVYDKPGAAIPFQVSAHELTLALNQGKGRENGLDLAIDGAAPIAVELVDWQRDPVRGDILHVDFKPV